MLITFYQVQNIIQYTMATESKRQQRFAGVIQQDLAELFQRDGKVWAPGAFVTVTKVRVTPDLAIARVYLSFLKTETAKADIANIKSKTSDIRYKLGQRIKNQARIVPQLEFFLDDTNEYVEHMDKLFDEISKETRQPD
jgi:ribosome-binding factor A